MAYGLTAFLRHTDDAGWAASDGHVTTHVRQVTGCTAAMACTLPGLEHLFMRLRRAGTRCESTLVSLDVHALPAGA
jgi:hypothetical protein